MPHFICLFVCFTLSWARCWTCTEGFGYGAHPADEAKGTSEVLWRSLPAGHGAIPFYRILADSREARQVLKYLLCNPQTHNLENIVGGSESAMVFMLTADALQCLNSSLVELKLQISSLNKLWVPGELGNLENQSESLPVVWGNARHWTTSGMALLSAAEECTHIYKDMDGGGCFCLVEFQSLGLPPGSRCLRKILEVQMKAQCCVSKQFPGGGYFHCLCSLQGMWLGHGRSA